MENYLLVIDIWKKKQKIKMSPAWPFAKDAYKSLCLRAIHCWHIYLSLLGWCVYFDQEQILSLWHSQWLAIPFERNVPARRKLRISKLERALQGGHKTQKRYLYTKKILHHEMLKMPPTWKSKFAFTCGSSRWCSSTICGTFSASVLLIFS